MSDHYQTLGVPNSASELEIKKAYRTLSLKYHPDRNPSDDAATKIREINDAYEVLSDNSKRRQYDLEQKMGAGMGGMPFGFPGMGGMGGMPFAHMASMGEPGGGDMGDIFQMLFGGGGGGMPGMHGSNMPEIRVFHGGMPSGMRAHFQTIQKPPPIVLTINVSMEQAFHGCTLPIEVERWIMIGEMKIQEEETLYITVPSGIDDNEMMLLKDKGNAASDQCKGDVKIIIHLENNSVFRRNGLDLMFRKSVTLKEALCGFAFEIPHLNGKTLSLNNKTSPTIVRPNYKKTVAGLGMMRDGAYGNLIIEFDVEFPETLTSEQIATLDNLLT